ncbi:MAG: multicopper oxidase domain-containing protein, partial [Acidimicrobiia bacterium]|nr:multicopper oxidase domain-containing protein [Acidimicrobiia bacterium]
MAEVQTRAGGRARRESVERYALFANAIALVAAVAVLGSLRITADDDVSGEQYGGVHDHSTHDHGIEDRFAQMIADRTGFDMSSHEGMEGPMLGPDWSEHTVQAVDSLRCPADAEVKAYDVVAMNVSIVLNRWGDHDPEGYMFAIRDQVDEIRAQERLTEVDHWGVSLGIGTDAIQPLTIRANVGDCLIVSMENDLSEPASFSIHGADVLVSSTGEPALTTNPDSSALPGETVVYEWYIDADHYGENTHYAHSHGPRERFQVGHGLFGAVIVEPADSEYFDNWTGEPLCESAAGGYASCRNSWGAMISPGDGSSDFREFAMFYHEVGNERFATVDKDGVPNPSIDPIVESYKPNGRAINYRSESFFRRLGEAEDQVAFYEDWLPDESEAYSSYAFGEPAMPIPQSYVGDPLKFRLIHAGSETFHVPHLHGGGIQWQRQQDVGDDGADGFVSFDAGLVKEFENSMPSSGNDSQTIGPSETYELEISCGSGGCQETAGDFLFHCHVASHYISGMWHFWRVYNTLQDDVGKTDDLATVAELPDREGGMRRAVTSVDLIGEQIEFAGLDLEVDAELVPVVVESQLPPQGVKRDEQDAEVMDWKRDGLLYLNEPESEYSWPNFVADDPGGRVPMNFDPATGQLAIPFLRPHLGSRPPFAPQHGPAPHLEPLDGYGGSPAEPGANGERSLCPAGAPTRSYNVHAITTDVPVTEEIT